MNSPMRPLTRATTRTQRLIERATTWWRESSTARKAATTLAPIGIVLYGEVSSWLASLAQAAVKLPFPFNFLPGMVVFSALPIAITFRFGGLRRVGGAAIFALTAAIALSIAHVLWLAIRPAVSASVNAMSNTLGFSIAAITSILAALIWLVVYVIREVRRSDAEQA